MLLLLLEERQKGKSLRLLGKEFGISGEQVRQLLKKHYGSTKTELIAEESLSRLLRYPKGRIKHLRGRGLLHPYGVHHHLYPPEEVEKARQLLESEFRCQICGKTLEKGQKKYCKGCNKKRFYFRYHHFPEVKLRRMLDSKKWQEAHPEAVAEIGRRASRKHQANKLREHLKGRYQIIKGKLLPLGMLVKVKSFVPGKAILDNGMVIPAVLLKYVGDSSSLKPGA